MNATETSGNLSKVADVEMYVNNSLHKWSVSGHTSQFAVIPMFIVIAAMVLHGLVCRVLWIRVVRGRQWYRTTAVPLSEAQLALFVSSCVAIVGMTDLLVESGEFFVGKWVLGDVLCRFFNGCRNANYMAQSLVCLFLLERVILNRNLAAQVKVFAGTSSLISAAFFIVSFIYSKNVGHRCVLNSSFTIKGLLYLPHYACLFAILVLTAVAVYVVRKRRSDFTVRQLQDGSLTIDDVERSLRRIENLCVVISFLCALAYTGRIATKFFIITHSEVSSWSFQLLYLAEGLWESSLFLSTGAVYFWLYPNYREIVKKFFAKSDPLDQCMSEAILSNN